MEEILKKIKEESTLLSIISLEKRNLALKNIIKYLKNEKEQIFSANNKDIENCKDTGLSSPIIKRLQFDESKINDVISGINDLISLPDPIGSILIDRNLDKDLLLQKISCPIGVIGVIFESRPDALVQISTLCLKSGNCVILKGGSEAANTNKALYEIILTAIKESGIPEAFITLFESREDISKMLSFDNYIDLLIPRGSNAFVKHIMDNSDIPVMGHADGICHIFVDESADTNMAVNIIDDSKTQYVAACNSVETLLVHEKIANELLPKLSKLFSENNVTILGCEKTKKIINCDTASDEDFTTEYLDYILSVKIISSLDEAIYHINKYGSHHTDCILSNTQSNIEKFMNLVDSAGVYNNCSTRFADGFRYGFGAEVGISTGKLHARGPVGLDGLVTYKYRLYGKGQIVGDYANGKRKFNFKDN